MNNNNISIILGSLRYKSAPNIDFSLKVPFYQNNKEIIDFERSIDVNLQQVYFDERQKSSKFRPTGKFQVIFQNAYSGITNYPPFENNLYYLDSKNSAQQACEFGPDSVAWVGLPQFNEFDFIRTDYNVVGYTKPPNEHLVFQSNQASTYNWNFFISYPYSSVTNQVMEIRFQDDPNSPFSWSCSDGLPFIIKNIVIGGNKLIAFKCPVKHGLRSGEYVELSISYNTTKVFQIYSLGLEEYGNDDFVFNLYDIGYTGTTFQDLKKGTFKRVLNNENVEATKSQYYVRKHKIITNVSDAILVKAGFEVNIFGKKSKFESSAFTPNNVGRVSVKEDAKSYTLTFNNDIDIQNLRDNQQRPVTELFFTVMWKGYFGYTVGTVEGLQKGWGFNLQSNPSNTNVPDPWWSSTNTDSYTNIPIQSYTNSSYPSFVFKHVKPLTSGDVLDGDYCEWNSYLQSERVITNLYHKIKFNPFIFNKTDLSPINRKGYYYQPHYPITIKVFSNYVENGNPREVEGIPDYAQFSQLDNQFLWRDIYEYGYFDEINRGVDYPFLNGCHYPYQDVVFRIIPEGSNYTEINVIFEPIIDFCE